jgi:ribonuclease HI
MAKKKYYVVWVGRKTGVFETWEECSKQISGFAKSVFKSFETRELAEQAFKGSSKEFIKKSSYKREPTTKQLSIIGRPIKESISVDGACSGATGISEYQGVHTETGEIIFKAGPFEDGTNNIVEFLAIVHALAYCKTKQLTNSYILRQQKCYWLG